MTELNKIPVYTPSLNHLLQQDYYFGYTIQQTIADAATYGYTVTEEEVQAAWHYEGESLKSYEQAEADSCEETLKG